MYFASTPFWLKMLYPKLIWDIKTTDKKIFLTFDDGPIPQVTPWVLEQLQKFDAHATFFCIGDNVKKHPDIFQQVLDQGHTIGNHTFHHLNGWNTPDDKYLADIQECETLFKTHLFRPPYGRIKRAQINLLSSYKIIMWDVLSGDFDASTSPVRCLHNTIGSAKAGSIVLFHDSLKAERNLRYALPIALSFWKEHGFEIAALDII